ncbi:MAG: hypothetical protein ACFFCE_17360 [Promethearchaeota archaeon]
MLLNLIEKKIQSTTKNDLFEKVFINLKKIIIPFSQIGNSKKPSYLYNGLEEIAFKERNITYKKILLNEFVDNFIKT